jgi:hypothetical protein
MALTPEQQHNIRNGVVNIYVITRRLMKKDGMSIECQMLLQRILMECNRIGVSAGIVDEKKVTIQ